MQKAHDPPGRSSGWHRVGQTSLKPERLFLNNLQKGRSGCGCGQCHLSSGGSCLCALTPPWPASSLPLGPYWGRDKLEMLRPPSAPERKVPPRGGVVSRGSFMQRENACTRLQTCRRVLLATRCCLCHLRLGRGTFVWRLPTASYHGPPGGASEDWAVWCIERKAQSCLQTGPAAHGATFKPQGPRCQRIGTSRYFCALPALEKRPESPCSRWGV